VLAPEQTAALQAQVEERMWVAADRAALQLLSSQPNSGADADAAGGEGGALRSAVKQGQKPHPAASGPAHTGSAGDPFAAPRHFVVKVLLVGYACRDARAATWTHHGPIAAC